VLVRWRTGRRVPGTGDRRHGPWIVGSKQSRHRTSHRGVWGVGVGHHYLRPSVARHSPLATRHSLTTNSSEKLNGSWVLSIVNWQTVNANHESRRHATRECLQGPRETAGMSHHGHSRRRRILVHSLSHGSVRGWVVIGFFSFSAIP
jgi:hypothetical protein